MDTIRVVIVLGFVVTLMLISIFVCFPFEC